MGAPRDMGGVRAAILACLCAAVRELGGMEVLMQNNTTIQLRQAAEPGRSPRYFTITVRENV
jgi:hypothetical protein